MKPYLPLDLIMAYVPAMRALGVSVVARSRRGFLTAYRYTGGDADGLSDYWQTRREGFIARHMAQVRKRREPLFNAAGDPTPRHLALIAWAYSPHPAKLHRRNPETTRRTRPDLWTRIVRAVTASDTGGKRGQWSARKAQIAVTVYKAAGGGYVGAKSPANSLARWTAQAWRTKSGRPSLETGERYLPEAAIDALSDVEYAETTRSKRAGLARGEQFTPQPKRIAAKVRHFRN